MGGLVRIDQLWGAETGKRMNPVRTADVRQRAKLETT
jgi:hypothetical protein